MIALLVMFFYLMPFMCLFCFIVAAQDKDPGPLGSGILMTSLYIWLFYFQLGWI